MFVFHIRCDSKRAKNAALSLLPIIGWMKIYKIKQWLPSDIISGVSTGLVAVLQGSILFFLLIYFASKLIVSGRNWQDHAISFQSKTSNLQHILIFCLEKLEKLKKV